nr:hypothetical protein [Nonomuraea sp. ATCC 55076]
MPKVSLTVAAMTNVTGMATPTTMEYHRHSGVGHHLAATKQATRSAVELTVPVMLWMRPCAVG